MPYTYLFVEAQASNSVYDFTYIYSPIIFLSGLAASALVLSNFNQTNNGYKRYMMLQILALAVSQGITLFAFSASSPFLYIVGGIVQAAVCGSLKLYLYEFMTEIIFPVSPVFALAILHSLSGLLSLLVQIFSDDTLYKDPDNRSFVAIVFLMIIAVCIVSLFVLETRPYKLNRTDYDMCRRSTMVSSYMTKGPRKSRSEDSSEMDDESRKNMYSNMNVGKKHDEFATSINNLLDHQAANTHNNDD